MNESQAAKRFGAIVEGVRQRGLSADVERVQQLLPHARSPRLVGEMARLLGFYWLRMERFDRALHFSEMAASRLPDNRDAVYNALYAEFKLGRTDSAVARGKRALATFGEEFVWHNILSTCLGGLGRLDESRVHGTRSLALKDAITTGRPGRDLASVPVPPFDAAQAQRQVICFSLFGTGAKYLAGAVHNAAAARDIYPGWTCRFHVDASVTSDTVAALAAHGAQIVHETEHAAASWGTLWRFKVADDPQVLRYLVRDADSLINLREAAAVQEWLQSGRHFHVMRDHYDHSELVLAGMWGGVRGALPAVVPAAQAFLARKDRVQPRTADQEFLREVLWPTIRSSVLVHDSQFAFGERRDFPAHAALPPGCWVGGDAGRLLEAQAPRPAGT